MTYSSEIKLYAKRYPFVFEELIRNIYNVLHNQVCNKGLNKLRRYCLGHGMPGIEGVPVSKLYRYEGAMEEFYRTITDDAANRVIAKGRNAQYEFLLEKFDSREVLIEMLRDAVKSALKRRPKESRATKTKVHALPAVTGRRIATTNASIKK